MKTYLLIVLATLSIVLHCSERQVIAQDPPDLNGLWKTDRNVLV